MVCLSAGDLMLKMSSINHCDDDADGDEDGGGYGDDSENE